MNNNDTKDSFVVNSWNASDYPRWFQEYVLDDKAWLIKGHDPIFDPVFDSNGETLGTEILMVFLWTPHNVMIALMGDTIVNKGDYCTVGQRIKHYEAEE